MKRHTSAVHSAPPEYLVDQSFTPPHGDPERAFLAASAPVKHRSLAARALAAGSVAAGALALGALAVGALAIGSLAIGRLALNRGHISRMRIGSLRVDRLQLGEFAVDQGHGTGTGPRPA